MNSEIFIKIINNLQRNKGEKVSVFARRIICSMMKYFFNYNVYYVYEKLLDNSIYSSEDFTPRLENWMDRFIVSKNEFDILVSKGYDFSSYAQSDKLRDWIEKGVIVFCVFIKKKLINIELIAMDHDRAIFDPIFLKVHYNDVAYEGGSFTRISCRSKGLHSYALVRICHYLKEKGVSRLILNARQNNIPSRKSIEKAGFSPFSAIYSVMFMKHRILKKKGIVKNEIKNVIWFNTGLVQSGGGERFSLEVMKSFRNIGFKSHYIVYNYIKDKVFEGAYDNLEIISLETQGFKSKTGLVNSLLRIIWLRKKIKEINPDVIITQGTWSQVIHLYLSTIFTRRRYAVYIFGSMFAFKPFMEMTKYAIIFKKNFNKIRCMVDSYKQIVPEIPPRIRLDKKLKNELLAFLKYLAVRKANIVFVLSERNRMEVKLLYGKNAVVLKGALQDCIFKYEAKEDIRKKLNLQNRRIVMTISRLVANKRVDLCIKAFHEIKKEIPSAFLVIGGKGPEEEALKKIVKELKLSADVKFVGYVSEKELWDYYCCCDAFVHMDLADFDITPLEVLALGKKVIWPIEMEMDKVLDNIQGKTLFIAKPSPRDTALAVVKALNTNLNASEIAVLKNKLSYLTWDHLAEEILNEIKKDKKYDEVFV